ncbi:MAG: Gfo/Idh/MocA family oxidoreductase [Devosia sp.]|uniref:Gfo/Idh/MocA family protein n=1 Tax=unclassified Devosia TaxID=196773 RepID=UPI001A018CDD|nr:MULTISPECIES: Gfo/Idh/MocA family oxidoreductase [unclassified Devosia]MBF0679167.1 Gfo/Idh/MocA family oxidoreductase [Devosia sp.]WEJ32276.1 Gfo/Idh/MocA family oxidoreductase [Devosia sp. SD17-2]
MTFRILQLGAGTRGRMWGKVAKMSDNVLTAAIVDPSQASLDLYSAENPETPAFTDLRAALASAQFDAVILVTPPDGHFEQMRRLFDAGLPILAEKPLATTLADAAAIVDMADASGLPMSVGLNFRYLPVNQTMRQWLTGEKLGQVGFGQFNYRTNRNGKRPGINRYPLVMEHPMMLEQTIHHLDLIRFVHGREVETIACREWNPPWSMYAHEANVNCLLGLEGGVEVNYHGTWSGGWNVYNFEWRVDCADGILVQRKLHSDLAYANSADPELIDIATPDAAPYYDDSVALLAEFIAAVRNGTPAPCDGRDHLRSLSLCFAGIESSQNGQAINMAEFYERNGLSRLLA